MDLRLKVSALALVALLLAGCAATGDGETATSGRPSVTASPALLTPATIHHRNAAILPTNPGKVVAVTTTEAAPTFTPSGHQDLVKDPKMSKLVRGVVTKVEYFHDPVGSVFTLVTLSVDDTIRGPASATITYLELGGYIRAADLAAINGAKDGKSLDTSGDAWVDVRFLGAAHSAVGQEQVVFLSAITDPQGRYQYESLQGPHGRYTWDPAKNVWGTLPAETIKSPVMTDAQVSSLH